MLFTCGVAVGLYVFGVAEPLYFYRVPKSWMPNWTSIPHKTDVDNDAQRAQQAIFMAVYHWGIHGWVPYILLALLLGIVSFRWGMPMTIRSCFYPLSAPPPERPSRSLSPCLPLPASRSEHTCPPCRAAVGDHALGIVGDFIDALSISTTTFGVCTSLGLGVTQLSRGLQFLKDISCSVKDNCVNAGGVWDITKYGAANCFCETSTGVYGALWGDAACLSATETIDDCTLSWLGGSSDDFDSSLYTIIAVITGIATLSVLSGLDRGIKTLSAVAFSLGAMAWISITYADNTWYVLNVVVQTTGYYLQHVIQVGFDCEAFQQLNFEFQDKEHSGGAWTNLLWGSHGDASAIAKIGAAGIDVDASLRTTDCGTPNPCNTGIISATVAAALYYGAMEGANTATVAAGDAAAAMLKTYRMSQTSIDTTRELFGQQIQAYGGSAAASAGVPCAASVSSSPVFANSTHVTTYTADYLHLGAAGDALCAGAVDTAACQALWAASNAWDKPKLPRCPETLVKDVHEWGSCSAHQMSCPITMAYYDDANAMFMDWWTIFYWAWWITWAPFVGFFVAIISRGRTVRQVIWGGFVCPTLFAILWFSVFGGLAIKMQRVAEVALKVAPEPEYASIECREHYSGATPITPEAKALAEQGYYMLTCMPRDDQIYYLMMPYVNIKGFLHVVLWTGLVIYFLTSSDSGSMTDDIISASGLTASAIPSWQKVFWCFTEGIVAISLVAASNGNALKSLQHVSIIIGLPFTIILCMFVPSLYRALKRELGEKDILESKRFNTQLLDVFELFKPYGGSPFPPMTHIVNIAIGLVVPAMPMHATFAACYPKSPMWATVAAFTSQTLLICWFALHIVETDKEGAHTIAWLCMTALLLLIAFGRGELRRKYDIWGSPLEDLFSAMMVYPIVLAQMQMQVSNDGDKAPTYFASADEVQAEMTALKPGSLPGARTGDAKEVKVETTSTA